MSKEIQEIIRCVDQLPPGSQAVLATVIDVRGSGYRLPGARMLMLADGETFGTVSGGCLEADVLERAKKVLATGRAEVFTYDTTENEDSVFSLNMGCRGVIRILLEAVDRKNPLIERLREVDKTRVAQGMQTLVSTGVTDDIRIGRHVFFTGITDRKVYGLPHMMAKMHPISMRFLDSGAAYDFATVETPDGPAEFVLERLEPPISVLVFGAGADAVPLVKIVSELGWQVTVHDHRPAFLTNDRFPDAERLVHQNIDEPLDQIASDNRTAAVIMTHNYARDRFILPALLRSDVFYIGALGPKRRTEQLLEELVAGGEIFTGEQLARLYAPVGLDIGADTPETIALSIIGEIQSVLAKRDSGHLRDRQGSIYDRK